MNILLFVSLCLVLLTGIECRSYGFAATRCGGALLEYAEGGIFYKYDQKLNQNEELCVWTIVPGENRNSTGFNGIRIELISEGFEQKSDYLTIAYATESGNITEFKTYDKGEKGAVEVPSTVVFVILSSRFSSTGKGFILYYEGIVISEQPAAEVIPYIGKQIYLDAPTGVYKYRNYERNAYNVFVLQDQNICAGIQFCRIGLKVSDFNVGAGPTGVVDTIQLFGIQRESQVWDQRLIIIRFPSISGFGSRYSSPKINVMAESGQTLIGILKTGKLNTHQITDVTLSWENGFYY